VATKPGYCLGSPKWSPDGSRIVYYEITTEGTWEAHRPEAIGTVSSQIVSVDVATGTDRVERTSGAGLKVAPQYVTATEIGYLVKGGADEGLAYVSGTIPAVKRSLRNPVRSPDGKSVIYEKTGFATRALDAPLYSWDADWECRFCDVFPVLSRQGRLAITQKQTGSAASSIVTMKADGSDQRVVFDTANSGLDPVLVAKGLAGAFRPALSPDGAVPPISTCAPSAPTAPASRSSPAAAPTTATRSGTPTAASSTTAACTAFGRKRRSTTTPSSPTARSSA
jgi:Tol biopolymer transport system component